MGEKIKVVELFAGVGGFRLGLEGWKGKSASSGYRKKLKSDFEVVWSNQWEPSTKRQHASEVYEQRFGIDGHSNDDIEKVPTEAIPDHDLLVGGFPCQDYSVATTLKNSRGLVGKKGVLWWSIHRILSEKKGNAPHYLFFENVDRLLKSPVKQRGRDFAVMLRSLDKLGYAVEWRVINAAEYGMPQRRRRVFFLGYHKDSDLYKAMDKLDDQGRHDWITETGLLAEAFPVTKGDLGFIDKVSLNKSLAKLSKDFNVGGKVSKFQNSGMMIKGNAYTMKTFSTLR